MSKIELIQQVRLMSDNYLFLCEAFEKGRDFVIAWNNNNNQNNNQPQTNQQTSFTGKDPSCIIFDPI